ncbi:hypothetical protein E4U59_000458 [Claviceps monticola]|nr:hypothetical protein E4U59_000458 [Claviceps monticola]
MSVPLRSANVDAAGKVTICKASNKLGPGSARNMSPAKGNKVGKIAGNEYSSPVPVTVRPAPNHVIMLAGAELTHGHGWAWMDMDGHGWACSSLQLRIEKYLPIRDNGF